MTRNEELVNYLIQYQKVLRSEKIISSFLKIDRKDFVTNDYKSYAYDDCALPIGHGQTISQPYVVAFMLELLNLKEDDIVLDIGSGSGYTTALIAEMVKKGNVIGVERIKELVEFGQQNLKKYNFANAKIIDASARLGIPKKRFDKIMVSASSQKVPDELLFQLKIGGTMVIPIKDTICQIIKDSNDDFSKKIHYGFVFVPLIY